MFEDPSSQISKVSNLKFLMPIVLHSSRDKHYYISLLYRIDNPGIQHIICQRLKDSSIFNIKEEIPQLIEILLKNKEFSHPVYCLLKYKASKNLSFRICLFQRLKSVLGTIEESKAEICYYLCCDILEIDNNRNRMNVKRYHRNKVNKHSLKHYYKTFYYKPLAFKKRSKIPLIQGLMLYFSKSVLSIFKTPVFSYFDVYSNTFNNKKNFKNLQFKNSTTPFRRNCLFLEYLVNISLSLKTVAVSLRHRVLRLYLDLINKEMNQCILDPLDPSRKIIRFSLEYAKVLDSAENCPFIVVFETVDKNASLKINQCEKSIIRKASGLMRQLEVIGDLGDVGDVDGIKESLVVAIENVLGRRNIENTTDQPEITIQLSENILEERREEYNQESNSISNKQVNLDILTTNRKYDELINTKDDVIELASDNSNTSDIQIIETNKILNNEKSLSFINNRLKITSPYSGIPGWKISSFIIKSGNVLKHEYLAYQVLSQMKEIFLMENLPIYIMNYRIILISDTSGLVETVDAQSIHRLKFDMKFKTLESYFKTLFNGKSFEVAKKNFLYSLVGYSLASYVLQIKDRHNGNILIDKKGHIIHVDFGFTFGKYPGIISVENAPFKFSSEYLDLIDVFEFKDLFIKGFKVLRKHREKLTRLVEIMKDSGYFEPFEFEEFVNRLRIFDSERELEIFCQGLIDRSVKNMRTVFYDQFQYLSNGYL